MSIPSSGTWNYPTPIRFGPGCLAQLPEACRELGMTQPILVTDKGLADLPIVAQAVEHCEGAGLGVGVFNGVNPNPNGRDVEEAVEALRRGEHDGVIAFGGGSALDVGKAVALMAGQTRPLWAFEDAGDNWQRVDEAGMLPCVAVPTTSGTGSEVGRCSVIVNEAEKRKVIIFHARMLPERVLLDPEVTVGLPAQVTAAVGMDALSHNLEAFCAPGYHPQADGIALEGMRLIQKALVRAVENGGDLGARQDMLVASMMGATAFQKGLGAMHSMSHPIGAHLKAHHGLTNAIVMPYVLEFNADVIGPRMDLLARALDLPGEGLSAVMAWVLELRQRLQIPHTLEALGFEPHHASLLAGPAAQDPTAPTNPRPLTPENMEPLFLRALSGELAQR
ncbi:MAG: alcohol dehydrogenase [Myxococcales bacterium]|nr:alcohol dehydrogenase [Myxococcales bacterium]